MTFAILQYPKDSEKLRRKARPIRDDEFEKPALKLYAQELAATMMQANGSGLSTTQVLEAVSDDGEPWRMFAMRVDETSFSVICNPEILIRGVDKVGMEGCLSFASVLESMHAPENVMLKFQNTSGVHVAKMFEGELARCIAHECDHLDGKLLPDRMASWKKALFLKRVSKARGRSGGR